MTADKSWEELSLNLRVRFIPHCLLRGLLVALCYMMGLYSSLVYFAEFLSYLKNGYVNPEYRGEFFVIDERLRPTGWVGLDNMIHEAYSVFLTPAFFFWFSVISWVLYQTFGDDLASDKYKSLNTLQQSGIDVQVGYFAFGWGIFIVMSLIIGHGG